MEGPTNAFDLTPEQQNTAALLDRLLGKALADRYLDFCRLAAGAFELRVSRPLAAHALREFDSMLRQVLAVPMDAVASSQSLAPDLLQRLDTALVALGFDSDAIQRAKRAVEPRLNHKTQIRKITSRLGLDPKGDVARAWVLLCDSFGRAHQRSFHRTLNVDAEFRAQYQQPFDMVVRAIAIALQSKYASLMLRVEDLVLMPDRSHAVSLFTAEIPGAMPLQWHFFQKLETPDWLSALAKHQLFDEPLPDSADVNTGGMRFRQWPVGQYLQRMAASTDAAPRELIAQALHRVAVSRHPDVHRDGFEILAALPVSESAPLATIAEDWLRQDSHFVSPQGPLKLIFKLAEAGEEEASLRVARELLRVWDENGQVTTHFSRQMYEHYLPKLVEPLTKVCGVAALELFADLLRTAGSVSGRLKHSHYSSQPITSDETAKYDLVAALISAVRRSAEMIVAANDGRATEVIAALEGHPEKIFSRLLLHILALPSSDSGEVADAYLTNAEFIEAGWCQHEYAEVALKRFQKVSSNEQAKILSVVNGVADKYRTNWKDMFEKRMQRRATTEDERTFDRATLRDTVWRWRAVLPPEQREAIEQIAKDLGDPDARWARFAAPEDESPLTTAEFATASVTDVLAYLKSWKPSAERKSQTITALAHQLNLAVRNSPDDYAAVANQFVGLRSIYVRRVIEGFQNVANNGGKLPWAKLLTLIEFAFGSFAQQIDPASIAEGDDPNWHWTCMAASELLAAGLRHGAKGIEFGEVARIEAIMGQLGKFAPGEPEIEDFEDRFKRDGYFAAQATLYGRLIEISILFLFWLSKDQSVPIGKEPRTALEKRADVKTLLDGALTDQSASGRVARAIMGRYLGYLLYFGEDWTRVSFAALFPFENATLRRATWESFLIHDRGPLKDLIANLHALYLEEIASLSVSRRENDHEFREDRLAEHLIILYLWGCLPADLLNAFWRCASPRLLQHAMSFLGEQLRLPTSELSDEVRVRGFDYWEQRLAAAAVSTDLSPFRIELGAIGHWKLRAQEDDVWMLDQLQALGVAGLVPSDAYNIFEWLAEIAPRHTRRALDVLDTLLASHQFDPWAYITQKEAIRSVLVQGRALGTSEINARMDAIVSRLSSLGETSFLDFVSKPPN